MQKIFLIALLLLITIGYATNIKSQCIEDSRTSLRPFKETVHDESSNNIYRRNRSVYGFADIDGDIIIPAQFELVKEYSCGLAAVCKGKRWGYINKNYDQTGRFVIEPEWTYAGSFNRKGLALVGTGNIPSGSLGCFTETKYYNAILREDGSSLVNVGEFSRIYTTRYPERFEVFINGSGSGLIEVNSYNSSWRYLIPVMPISIIQIYDDWAYISRGELRGTYNFNTNTYELHKPAKPKPEPKPREDFR